MQSGLIYFGVTLSGGALVVQLSNACHGVFDVLWMHTAVLDTVALSKLQACLCCKSTFPSSSEPAAAGSFPYFDCTHTARVAFLALQTAT